MKSVKNRFTQILSTLLSSALIFTSLSLSEVARAHASPGATAPFSLPETLGSITDFHPGSGQVILIQDLHLHYPTQKRILGILNHLYAKNIVSGRVAIEGLQGDYDTTPLASIPAGRTKDKLVDYFMQKGELSGDEAFAILRGEGHRLYGIDDGKFYQLNRELYKKTLSDRHTLEAQLGCIQQRLAILKKEHYNRALRQLDKIEPYDSASSEDLLNQKREAVKDLKASSQETTLVENLIEIDHSLYFLNKLLRQETTLDEVRYVAQRLPQFSELTAKLLEMNGSAKGWASADLEETLKASVDFYAVALMRDQPIAEHTLQLVKSQRTVVLVAGGFHTAGVTRALKSAGVGYAVVTPTIKEDVGEDYHQLYEKRIAGQSLTVDEVAHDFHIQPVQSGTHELRPQAQTLASLSSLLDPSNLKARVVIQTVLRGIENQRTFWSEVYHSQPAPLPETVRAALSTIPAARPLPPLRQRLAAIGWKPSLMMVLSMGLAVTGIAYGMGWIADPIQIVSRASGASLASFFVFRTPQHVQVSPLEQAPDSHSSGRTRGESTPVLHVATTELSPAEELATLREFHARLKQEQAKPGSVTMPKVVVISDQHGTIDKFDALIVDAIRSVLPSEQLPADFKLDPDKQLNDQFAIRGVNLPDDLKGRIFFHNLGDFMDRGPYGVKIFRRSMELVDTGLSDFVIGNHDFWEFMNLQAFHLPWYDGYNLYNYHDAYDVQYGDVAELIRHHHRSEAVTRTRTWWAEKLAEFTTYQDGRQKFHWVRFNDQINGTLILAAKISVKVVYFLGLRLP